MNIHYTVNRPTLFDYIIDGTPGMTSIV